MSTENRTDTPRKPRKTLNACIACRQSKIKCSGEEPCANCRRRIIKCKFTDGGNKILVSEKYLQELKRLSKDPNHFLPAQGSHSAKGQSSLVSIESNVTPPHSALGPASYSIISNEDTLPVQSFDNALSIWTSPFAAPSTTIRNTHNNRRKWIWLAPWSLWSFTVRLTSMMTKKLQPEPVNSPPSCFTGTTSTLQWKHCADDSPPDISGIPSIDHALYLFETVKFHLGLHYRFFDDREFIENLHEFYLGGALQKATASRLWYVQFLIVIAFGKAFLSTKKAHLETPGAKFFTRAMSLLPDLASLWKDSILAVEVLVLAGLYLYSIDERESAHVYVGQAMRIAQLEGLHTQLPEDELGADTVTRCRGLWWNLYIIDRHFSTSLGLPVSVSDSDISVLTGPSGRDAEDDTALNLRVKLSHLLSVIQSTIYRSEKTELVVFLENTRSTLQALAGHARQFEDIIRLNLRNEVETMTKGTRHITLLYHQCVIVATRPLLLSVLQERLDKLGCGNEEWRGFFALTTTLISTGIKSAVKTLQILSDEDNPLEVFLPFDLEFAYSAAVHLIMANTLFPEEINDQGYAQLAIPIVDEMISRGSRVAESRRAELLHLGSLFEELAAQSERRGLQQLSLSIPTGLDGGMNSDGMPLPISNVPLAEYADQAIMEGESLISPDANLEFFDNVGISSGDFLSIVDQIGNPDFFAYGMMENS